MNRPLVSSISGNPVAVAAQAKLVAIGAAEAVFPFIWIVSPATVIHASRTAQTLKITLLRFFI
jgi:hypothetical protein